MANSAQFTDRHALIVPKDGQDQPADDDVAIQNLANASDYNWGDAIQENLLDTFDSRLVASGTLASRGTAGSSEPVFYLVTNGGDSDDQPYLTYNDDSVWHIVGELLVRKSITDADSPYAISEGETVWVDASSASVTVNLPAPADQLSVRIVVTDASNNVTVSRNASESIDGSASDVTLSEPGVIELQSDGTNWRRTAVETEALKDGGAAELDVADLAGGDGTNGQIPVTDGSAVTWQDQSAGFTQTTKTSNYTASTQDSVWADSSSNAVTVTLPSPAQSATVRVINVDDTNGVTITEGSAGDNINDATGTHDSLALDQGESLTLESDGSTWWVV